MLRKYSKIAEFNILKTSLSSKMSNAYTSNDRIIMSIATFVRPSQGFWGFMEKGYLLPGIWGEGSFIFRNLGRKHIFGGFYGAGTRGLRKNVLGSWGERPFSFREQEAKSPPPLGIPHLYSIYRLKILIICKLKN